MSMVGRSQNCLTRSRQAQAFGQRDGSQRNADAIKIVQRSNRRKQRKRSRDATFANFVTFCSKPGNVRGSYGVQTVD
jgi:hypothetical protein